MLKRDRLKTTVGNEIWIFMTISLTNFCQSCSLKLGNIYVSSLDIALISILISGFFFFLCAHTYMAKKARIKTKPFIFCLLRVFSPSNPSVSLYYGTIIKLQDCTLGVSAMHREPSNPYHKTEILSGVTGYSAWWALINSGTLLVTERCIQMTWCTRKNRVPSKRLLTMLAVL